MDSPAQTNTNEFRPTFDIGDMPAAIAVMMDVLGEPRHVGCCFAFRRDKFPPDIWPTANYEHRIYADGVTDYYIAVRPNADGEYDAKALEGMKRLR